MKFFLFTLILAGFYFGVSAQQPVVWMIEGDGTKPSSSWAAVNYDVSSSVVGGVWKLYQPSNDGNPATAAKVCYIQYNPGRITDVTTTYSNIETNNPDHRYLIIGLKNHTALNQLRFYYRYNNAGTESWKPYDFAISTNDTEFKEYFIDVQALPNWNDYSKMPLIRFDFVGARPTYDAGTETPNLLLEVDYLGFFATMTLPVSLTSFTAKKQLNGIILDWSTASEQDNSHFDIMRSIDGKTFEKISTISGYGNSSETRSYRFTDFNPKPGTNYYQLRQVDFNGNTSFSKITAVDFGIINSEFKVFADADKQIKVSVSAAVEGNGVLYISNTSGQKLFEQSYQLIKGRNILEVPSLKLPGGIYVAALRSGDGLASSKFIAP